MKNGVSRLVLFGTLLGLATQAPLYSGELVTTAYSAYKLNKLKNDFLNAVNCTIKPWTCKAGRVTLMVSAFALMLYLMHGDQLRRRMVAIPAQEEMVSTPTGEEAPKPLLPTVQQFETVLKTKAQQGPFSKADVKGLIDAMQKQRLSADYYHAAANFFNENAPLVQQEAAMTIYETFIKPQLPDITRENFEGRVAGTGFGRFAAFGQ